MLPFNLGKTQYEYFANNQLRVEIKNGIETGIKIETQRQQQQRAIQAYTLYEIASEIAQRPIRAEDLVQKDAKKSAKKPWLLLNKDGSIQDRYPTREEATLMWVSQVASSVGRMSELGGSYSSRFKQMLLDAPVNEEMDAEMVAIFLRFRGEYKTENGEWESLNKWCHDHYGTDWGLEQVRQMPSELTEAIYKVISKEDSTDGNGSESEETQESLPLASGSEKSKTSSTTQSTGKKSSGESNSVPSEEMNDSTTKTSLSNALE